MFEKIQGMSGEELLHPMMKMYLEGSSGDATGMEQYLEGLFSYLESHGWPITHTLLNSAESLDLWLTLVDCFLERLGMAKRGVEITL